jgi:hypothetical protein
MAEVKQDVDVRGIGKFLVWLTAGVLGSAALMWFVFDQFTAREARLSPPEERMEFSNPQKVPPEPRLEVDGVAALKAFRADEDALVNGYGWVDPEKGIVRIPVDRALDLVAKEGLK